jgi:tetratricopeptide (TPR) repeat protein
MHARQMIVEKAFAYLDRLSRESPDDPRLLHELATVYSRLGSLQGGLRAAGGVSVAQGKAQESYQRALRLRERIAHIAPEHFENRRELGAIHVEQGEIASIAGRSQAAVTSHRRGLALLEEVLAAHPNDWRTRVMTTRAHLVLAMSLGCSDAIANIGRPSEGARHMETAVRLNRAMLAERADDLDLRILMVTLYNEHATCMEKVGRADAAIASQLEAIEMIESLLERTPDSLHYRRELAVAYGNRAAAALRTDKAEALRYTQKALPLYESLAEATPGNDDALRDLAIGHRNVGKGLLSLGDLDRAMPHIRRATELLQLVTSRNPDSAFMARQLAFTYLTLSEALLARGEHSPAMTELEKGIRICERLIERDAKNMVAVRTLALSYAQAGKIEEARAVTTPSRWAQARTRYLEARDTWGDLARAGEIPSLNVPQVELVREAIERCDAALARRRG